MIHNRNLYILVEYVVSVLLCACLETTLGRFMPQFTDCDSKKCAQEQSRRKWRKMSADFPTKIREPQSACFELECSVESRIDCELANEWRLDDMDPFKKRSLDLELGGERPKRVRRKKKFKEPKPHKEVRSKHCRHVIPRARGKQLYIKARNYALIGTHTCRLLPLGPPIVRQSSNYRSHYLTRSNLTETGLQSELAAFLLELQDREITPEDYDRLVQLEAATNGQNQKKSAAVLSRWLSRPVDSELADPGNDLAATCVICMELFETDQRVKTLLCGHSFHSHCLTGWTRNSAPTCPLDNLSIYSMRPAPAGRISEPQAPPRIYRLPDPKKAKVLRRSESSEVENAAPRGRFQELLPRSPAILDVILVAVTFALSAILLRYQMLS